jgi:RNA 2',3'-cyclic 3'-phosphodiesterase
MSLMTPSLRVFIAIELSEQVKDFLAKLSLELKRFGADVRWVRIDGIHLTLKFLGEVRSTLIPQIDDAVQPIFASQEKLLVQVRGLGIFPSTRNPRIIWAGVEDNEERLTYLAEKIDSKLVGLGFLRENRVFRPHLTLGRIKSKHDLTLIIGFLEKHKQVTGPYFHAHRAVLFQSVLKPTGAEYSPLSFFNFGVE